MAGMFDWGGGVDLETLSTMNNPTMDTDTWAQIARAKAANAAAVAPPMLPQVPVQGFDDSSPAPILPTSSTIPPMQGLDLPVAIAKSAAARGIGPPPGDLTPPVAPSLPSWANAQGIQSGPASPPIVAPANSNMSTRARAPSAPLDIRSEAQKAGEGAAASGKEPTLADALRGVKMPASPELQRLGTPAAPRPTGHIKGGEILALLQAMSAGGGGTGYQLPSTLGQALLGRK